MDLFINYRFDLPFSMNISGRLVRRQEKFLHPSVLFAVAANLKFISFIRKILCHAESEFVFGWLQLMKLSILFLAETCGLVIMSDI